MSVISRTTMGGAEFEQLCRGGIRNYSFNLADIRSERKVKHIKRKLVSQLEDTTKELELHSERRIGKLYIGKTFIQRRRRAGGGFMTFNPLNHHTWKKNGISSRWGIHKHEDYGRDGLVVLGAITKQTVPERCRDRVHQEDFTLAMEQKLLHHYLLSHPDSRVVNDTFTAGRPPERNHYAYAVYMAFSYTDDDDESKGFNFNEEDNLEQDIPSSPQSTDDSCTNTGDTSQTVTNVVQGTNQTSSNYKVPTILPAGPTIQPNDQAPRLSLSSLTRISFDHSPSPPSSPPSPPPPPPPTTPPPHSPPTSHSPRSKKRKLNLSTRQRRLAQELSSQNPDQASSSSSQCTIPTPHRLFTTEQRRPEANPKLNLSIRQRRKAQAPSENPDQASSSSSQCTIPTPRRLFTTEKQPEANPKLNLSITQQRKAQASSSQNSDQTSSSSSQCTITTPRRLFTTEKPEANPKLNLSIRQRGKAQASSSQNPDQASSSSSHSTIPTPRRLFTTEQQPEDNPCFRFVENYILQRYLADRTVPTPQEEQSENGTSQPGNGTSQPENRGGHPANGASQTETEGRPGNVASSSENSSSQSDVIDLTDDS